MEEDKGQAREMPKAPMGLTYKPQKQCCDDVLIVAKDVYSFSRAQSAGRISAARTTLNGILSISVVEKKCPLL